MTFRLRRPTMLVAVLTLGSLIRHVTRAPTRCAPADVCDPQPRARIPTAWRCRAPAINGAAGRYVRTVRPDGAITG
jgi:hypothetical protein